MSENPVQTDIIVLPEDCLGQRLDKVLATTYPELSRSRLVSLLKSGALCLYDKQGQVLDAAPAMRLKGGESVQLLEVPPLISDEVLAQPVSLDLIHEDDDLRVFNKSAGLVMHPAAGNRDNTVQNGLLHLDDSLRDLPRAGIVHRLDKDTTGLFVVARSQRAYTSLVNQLQTRSMGRNYMALVYGELIAGGTVDQPIARHPKDRLRMAVKAGGKPAITHYRVAERLGSLTLLDVSLSTGRTHQIRVHMAALRHPLVGDSLYSGGRRRPAGFSDTVGKMVYQFGRQALHAHTLSLIHPCTEEKVSWSIDLPTDFTQLLNAVRQDL